MREACDAVQLQPLHTDKPREIQQIGFRRFDGMQSAQVSYRDGVKLSNHPVGGVARASYRRGDGR
jgi:hypothetical protein